MVTIDHRKSLTLKQIVSVAVGEKVTISRATTKQMDARRQQIVKFVVNNNEPAYGFNRGFGHNVDVAVSDAKLEELQRNLIRSHSLGLGDAAPTEVVRAAMLLRLQSLTRGYSGVRSLVTKQLVALLNAGITPEVPKLGSVGASGDLAPLSHIGLALIGEGMVFGPGGRRLPARMALKQARIKPLKLQMKEGLALNNGVQFSNALACLGLRELWALLKQAAANTALVAQVMLAADTPFLAELHELRPHPGAQQVAAWIWKLMKNSPMRDFHRDYSVDCEIQDPYNIRCAAQILGACHDLLAEAEKSLLIEANSVTDNPLLLPKRRNGRAEYTRIVSGGHFHGMPIATKIFHLLEVMAIIAKLCNVRCARFVDEARNRGLGNDCIWPGLQAAERACSSGMMLVEYSSASLANTVWGAAMPSHLFSISTDAGQEDHVSMSAGLAIRVWETLPRVAECLALELAFCAQAAAIRKVTEYFPANADKGKRRWPKAARRLSQPSEKLLAQVDKIFPTVTNDRVMSTQIMQLASHIRAGKFDLGI